MAFAENLDAFFLDFGLLAIVDGSPVDALFDNQFATALGFTAGTAPVLIVKSADIGGIEVGASVSVASAAYTVAAIEPDGTGLTLLRLEAA